MRFSLGSRKKLGTHRRNDSPLRLSVVSSRSSASFSVTEMHLRVRLRSIYGSMGYDPWPNSAKLLALVGRDAGKQRVNVLKTMAGTFYESILAVFTDRARSFAKSTPLKAQII